MAELLIVAHNCEKSGVVEGDKAVGDGKSTMVMEGGGAVDNGTLTVEMMDQQIICGRSGHRKLGHQ